MRNLRSICKCKIDTMPATVLWGLQVAVKLTFGSP